MGGRGYSGRSQVRRERGPSLTHLLTYVGGGALGLLFSGVVFLPLYRSVAFGLMLFSILYLLGGVLGLWLWRTIDPRKQ